MNTARVLLRAFLLWTGIAAGLPLPADPAAPDLSAFREFSYSREGLCVPLGEVYRAGITIQENGDGLLRMSYLALGDGSPPESSCIDSIAVLVFGTCAKEVRLEDRLLTPAELEPLRALFSKVEIQGYDPLCEVIGRGDPCVVDRFAWDSSIASDDRCIPPFIDWDEAQEIRDLLASSIDVQRFHRGDSNGDGAVDISDAIDVLDFLFTGGAASDCSDAADASDDGRIDLSDPIATLGFLFLGTGNLPPGCVLDLTEDDLTCRFYPPCP